MKVYIISFLAIILSCNKLSDINYDSFTIYKKFVNLNLLKLNGVYKGLILNNTTSDTYLFRDGSFFSGGTSKIVEIDCPKIDSRTRELPWFWGFFNIESNRILIQKVNSVSIQQHRTYQIDNYEGIILNDTTFVIQKYIDYRNKVTIANDTFKFYECMSKPDSMNVILRNIGM
jgi:hypothetical protein